MILKVVDDKSGAEKKRYEFSQKQFRDILQTCRVNLWILRNGLFIFLENNPEIERKIASKRTYKIREIKEAAVSFAANRNFEIKDFKLDNSKTKLELSVKYSPPIVGRNEQIFFGTAEAYDVVHQEVLVKLEYQILDIVKCCLLYLVKTNLPLVVVNIFDADNSDLGIVEYEKTELLKLLEKEGEVKIPIPSKGNIPEMECKIDVPIRVPYGKGALFEKLLEERKKNLDSK